MQFIDQSAAYAQKSISPAKAVETGRARILVTPGAEKLAVCFRPDLKVANDFDRGINARLKFFDLATPEKLDLMIKELVPGFYHPDQLPQTGQDRWRVRFVVDGNVVRTLTMDAKGIRPASASDGHDVDPDIEVETDIVTLMAMLRSEIATYHLKKPAVTNANIAGLGKE